MTPRPVAPAAPRAVDTSHPSAPPAPRPAPRSEPVQRWRLVLAREALEGGASQKAWLAALTGALAESGLPLAGLDGDPPRPRVTLGAPLPSGVPGERELVDVHLSRREPAWRIRELVRAALPAGDRLVECYDVWIGEPPLPGRVTGAGYRVAVRSEPDDPDLPGRLAAAAGDMLAATSLPRTRRKGEASVSYDLRPFLAGLTIDAGPGGGATVRCVLRHDPEKGVGRPEEVLAELEDRVGAPLRASGLVRERLLLADELPPRAPAAASPGHGRPPPPRPRTRARPGGR